MQVSPIQEWSVGQEISEVHKIHGNRYYTNLVAFYSKWFFKSSYLESHNILIWKGPQQAPESCVSLFYTCGKVERTEIFTVNQEFNF